MVRPPKSVSEVIETLKQADARYEAGKEYLFGAAANPQLSYKKRAAESSYEPLSSVPKGMTLSRFYYPPSKSEIILVGLKRRAIIHSSYLYGKQLAFYVV